MGSGISNQQFATVEAALAAGKTQEEIDAWQQNNKPTAVSLDPTETTTSIPLEPPTTVTTPTTPIVAAEASNETELIQPIESSKSTENEETVVVGKEETTKATTESESKAPDTAATIEPAPKPKPKGRKPESKEQLREWCHRLAKSSVAAVSAEYGLPNT